MTKPFIKVFLERPVNGRIVSMDIGETPPQTYENPVYNKRLQFNIESDNDTVRIVVADKALSIETRL